MGKRATEGRASRRKGKSPLTPNDHLKHVQAAFYQLQQKLRNEGTTQGDLTLTYALNARVDTDKCLPKLQLSHYHYGKFSEQTICDGFDYYEVEAEFLHRLKRDQKLTLLTHQGDDQ